MLKQKKLKYFLGTALAGLTAMLLMVSTLVRSTGAVQRQISAEQVVDFGSANQDGKFLFLSDIDYMPASATAYDRIRKDQINNGSKISLRYGGEARSFNKGYWAHATSNLYFDLREYQDYDYLTAYVGVNTTATTGVGSVKFCVYTSTAETIDPTVAAQWGSALTTEEGATDCNRIARPEDDAVLIKIPIRGVNYVRFFANANGSNSSDHAVYGDLKLIKADYVEDKGLELIPTVEAMDGELKRADAGAELIEQDADYEMQLLRRNLVQKVSRWTLTRFVEQGEDERAMMNWLYNDLGALKMYTTGGEPTGGHGQALAVLTQLYAAYKDDLADITPLTTTSGTRGELYQKMMITLALTHSKQVRFWIRDLGEMANNPASPDISRPLDRYAVYKRMYLAGKLANQVFEQLEVEEMRYVMFTELGDDEIEWLHDWLPTVGKGLYTYPPVPYISIGSHYWYDQNYDLTYIDPRSNKTWEEVYKLRGSNYTDGRDKSISGNYFIGFEAKAPHLWMINYYGGVCWQISNFGQNMTASYGVPSTTLGQPGHLAFANYEMGTGVPAWALTNDVSGWAASTYTGYTNTNTYHPVRQMNNWGAATGEYAYLRNRFGFQGSYLVMAQAAINDFEHYEKSQMLVKLAEVYSDDLVKQAEMYRQALEAQNFNFDAWYGLMVNFIKQGNKTAEEWYNFVKEMKDSRLGSFAVPYHDLVQTLLTQIPANSEADLATTGYSLAIEMMLREQLEWMAANANNANIEGIFRQGGVSRILANALLGRLNNEIATFSFDGEEAGVLKLGAKYENSNAAFEFSLDGGETWLGANGSVWSGNGADFQWVTDKKIQLTADQLAQMTAEYDLKVHIQGVPREGNIYTIDIKEGTLPGDLYANDKENRIVGVNTQMEWRTVTTDGENKTYGEWVSYADESPLRVGEITIQVRVGATGVYLPSAVSAEYRFTSDTDPETRRYIPVSHLSVAAISSQALGGGKNGNATYAIDGNFHTRWHSAWDGSDHNQWIVIRFDHQVELAALGFVPAGGGNGRILQGEIYVTTEEAPDMTNIEAIRNSFELVGKISNDCSNAGEVLCDGPWPDVDNATVNNLNPRTFEFRRTETVAKLDEEGNEVVDEAGETVTEERVTHEAVPARYVAIKATQTSNYGNFIAARMLNFYEDKTKNPVPTAGVAYSTQEPTNGDVIARLINTTEEEIEAVDENGNKVENGFTHIFHENGTHTFRFRKVNDANRDNIGTAIAKVDWITKVIPNPTVTYICVDDNLDGSNQTQDCSKAQGKTNRSVSVKLTFPESAQVRILNNGQQQETDEDDNTETEAPDPGETENPDNQDETVSKDENSLDPFTYLFMRNGRFTFRYEDAAGNQGSYTAEVDWIDKAVPKVNVVYDPTNETTGEVVATLVPVPMSEGGRGGEDDDMEMGDFELIVNGLYDEEGYEYGEEFIVMNNEGAREYHFKENGEFTFTYRDAAGNLDAAVAKVDWIKKAPNVPDTSDKPTQPDDTERPDEPDHSGDGEQNPGGSDVTKPDGTGRPNGNNGSLAGGVNRNPQGGADDSQATGDAQQDDTNGDLGSEGDKQPDEVQIDDKRNEANQKDQDKTQGDKSGDGEKAWYENPWVWAAGGTAAVTIAGVGVAMVKNRWR